MSSGGPHHRRAEQTPPSARRRGLRDYHRRLRARNRHRGRYRLFLGTAITIRTMRIPLFRIDAFTNQAFRGNPAAVCPLHAWLDDELLRKVATENNLSET